MLDGLQPEWQPAAAFGESAWVEEGVDSRWPRKKASYRDGGVDV